MSEVDPAPFEALLEQQTVDHAARMQRHADEMYAGMVAFATGNAQAWWDRKFQEAMKLLDGPGETTRND